MCARARPQVARNRQKIFANSFFGVDFLNKNRKTLSIVSYILGIVLLLFLTSLLFNMNQE